MRDDPQPPARDARRPVQRELLPWPIWLVAAGAALMIFSPFRTWIEVDVRLGGSDDNFKVRLKGVDSDESWIVGHDVPDGYVVIACALLVVAAAVQYLVTRGQGSAVVIIMLGFAALGWSVVSFLLLKDEFDTTVRDLFEEDGLGVGSASLSARFGVWGSIVGAALAVLGGALLRDRARRPIALRAPLA